MEANTLQFLKIQFGFNSSVISKNIAGISNEESLVFPNGNANPANWVLGHLIQVRNAMISILGGNPVWNEEEFSVYNRGEKPENHVQNLTPFENLINYYKDSEKELNRIFSILKETDPKFTEDLAALMLHEIYHAGQLGYQRRLLGKEGAIK